ncbi:MAG: hypothetical protein V1830_05375 [Candidatus Omnitrophota bacterium]
MEMHIFYDWTFFDILREVIFWSSPAIFILGVAMLMYSNYKNFEALMAKEYGLRKRVLPELEKNIYTFHEWCLKKHTLIGMACIIYSVVVFMLLKDYHSLTEVIGDIY